MKNYLVIPVLFSLIIGIASDAGAWPNLPTNVSLPAVGSHPEIRIPTTPEIGGAISNAWKDFIREGAHIIDRFSAQQYAELGRVIYPMGAAYNSNQVTSQQKNFGLPVAASRALRDTFSQNGDQMMLIALNAAQIWWNVAPYDRYTNAVKGSAGSAAQTFGLDIYMDSPSFTRLANDPPSRLDPELHEKNLAQVNLQVVIHELCHVRQFLEQLDGTTEVDAEILGAFGYRYFRAQAAADYSYEQNEFEKECNAVEAKYQRTAKNKLFANINSGLPWQDFLEVPTNTNWPSPKVDKSNFTFGTIATTREASDGTMIFYVHSTERTKAVEIRDPTGESGYISLDTYPFQEGFPTVAAKVVDSRFGSSDLVELLMTDVDNRVHRVTIPISHVSKDYVPTEQNENPTEGECEWGNCPSN